MTLVVVVDVIEELSEENKRLFKELLFANNCLKVLIEFKTFTELLFNTFKYNFSFDDLLKYEGLGRKVEEVLVRPAEDRPKDEAKKEPTFECCICNQSYPIIQSLRRHLRELHNKSGDLTDFITVKEDPNDGSEALKCDVCNRSIHSKTGLDKHLHFQKPSHDERNIEVNTNPRLEERRTVFDCKVCSSRYNFIQDVKKQLITRKLDKGLPKRLCGQTIQIFSD